MKSFPLVNFYLFYSRLFSYLTVLYNENMVFNRIPVRLVHLKICNSIKHGWFRQCNTVDEPALTV